MRFRARTASGADVKWPGVREVSDADGYLHSLVYICSLEALLEFVRRNGGEVIISTVDPKTPDLQVYDDCIE